jgi:hypothetical protein
MTTSSKNTITAENARTLFEEASQFAGGQSAFEGRGIIISAGGPFVPSAYVVVRLLRHFGVQLPIEIWHAGHDEIPDWAREALGLWGVTFHDVMPFCEGRPLSEMRGWPIKPAALMNSRLREVLFLDADAFPLRNLEFLFDSPQFAEARAIFWPDNRRHRMVAGGTIWPLTGLAYRADPEFETGIFLVDKTDCWRELKLTEWLNQHSSFWYDHVLGDKDTFYLAFRKLGRPFMLAPPCKRFGAVITRHHWIDEQPVVDHRTGTSKYHLPKRVGPFTTHLLPYKHRSQAKNLYDEIFQRFFVRDFPLHVRFLDDLAAFAPRSLLT